MMPLCQRMLEDLLLRMRLRNLSAETQRGYIHSIAGAAGHFRPKPGTVTHLPVVDEQERHNGCTFSSSLAFG